MERADDDENLPQKESRRSSMQNSNHSTKGSSISSKRSSTTSGISEKEEGNKYCRWLLNTVKICLAIWFVYVFIFAIGLLSDSFQVLGGAFLNDSKRISACSDINFYSYRSCWRIFRKPFLRALYGYPSHSSMPVILNSHINFHNPCRF